MSQLVRALRCMIGLAFFLPPPAFAQVQSATIYFVPWEVETRFSYGPENVRQGAAVKTDLRSASLAQSFHDWLTSKQFQDITWQKIGGLRLVVDLTLQDGTVKSYYANQFQLFDVSTGQVRPVDNEFKARFSAIYR